MLKTKFYTKLSLLAIFFSISNFSFAEENGEILPSFNQNEEAKNLYIKSFFDKKKEKLEDEIFEKEEAERKTSWNLTPNLLNSRTIRSIIFNEDIVNFEKNWPSDKNVYNKYLFKDCNIFLGKNENPNFNFISRINRTKTIVGEATLASLLTRPSTNIQELLKRQQTIQTLINFKQKDDVLDKILNTYKNVENNVLSLFSTRDPFYNLTVNEKIQDTFLFKNKSRNTITFLGHNKILKKDFFGIFFRGCLVALSYDLMMRLLQSQPMLFESNFHNPFPPIFNMIRDWSSTTNFVLEEKSWFGLLGGQLLYTCYNVWFLHSAFNNYVENDKILRGIARRLYDISIVLRLSKKLTEVIDRDKQLKKIFGDNVVSSKLLFQKINNDKTLRSIIKFLLNKHEMLRDLNYFTDNAGYILFAYDNLELIKENIKNVIADIGFIDAYCSCADLFIENANKENHFVFAQYIPRTLSKTPYIKFENLWNPFLTSEEAVPNKIEMGVYSTTQCTNMILTGPNAGGKSTYINSVLLAILMGQTIGFAPGNEILFTPFNKINSYIEVKDDIADGKSAFIAEVDRCFSHFEILKNLKENEFAFSAFDEPFRGTNPIEGSAVEYSTFEKMGNFKNSLTILATHYPIMTLLEDNNFNSGFRNYKVYIKKDVDNKILFTYKIIPGRAKQSIAIDLLFQTGYKTEILKHAREIVRNPKLYETKFDDKISQGKW